MIFTLLGNAYWWNGYGTVYWEEKYCNKFHNQTMFETNNEILWKETQTILPWFGFNCQSLNFISIEQKAY